LHRDKLIEYIYIYKAIYATINIYTQGQKCVYYAIYAKHSTLLITCIMYMTFMYINGSETHTHTNKHKVLAQAVNQGYWRENLTRKSRQAWLESQIPGSALESQFYQMVNFNYDSNRFMFFSSFYAKLLKIVQLIRQNRQTTKKENDGKSIKNLWMSSVWLRGFD